MLSLSCELTGIRILRTKTMFWESVSTYLYVHNAIIPSSCIYVLYIPRCVVTFLVVYFCIFTKAVLAALKYQWRFVLVHDVHVYFNYGSSVFVAGGQPPTKEF